MAIHQLELFADYFQFYLKDEDSDSDLNDSWTPAAVDKLLALAPGMIGVGTVRDQTVPVTIEVRQDRPVEMERWDKVNDCEIDIKSGSLVVAGSTDYFPEAKRIRVEPGVYCARVLYGDLGTVSADGLDGEDRYKIVLWPKNAGIAY